VDPAAWGGRDEEEKFCGCDTLALSFLNILENALLA
jgi:hypothetical protein